MAAPIMAVREKLWVFEVDSECDFEVVDVDVGVMTAFAAFVPVAPGMDSVFVGFKAGGGRSTCPASACWRCCSHKASGFS
jgi:hypothetical protein